MTRGERGGEIEVRKAEFVEAMNHWGFDYELLKFPDLSLAWTPLKEMVETLAVIINNSRINVAISFDPREITYGFDHPDHNATGQAARVATTMVAGSWPKLYLWTGAGGKADQNRLDYFKKFYPSQYKNGYKQILENIGEKYIKVR